MSAAQLLSEALAGSGLKARQLAERSGTSEGRISDYLSGRHQPSAARLEDLLAACGFELRLSPRRDHNGLVLAELLDLADALSASDGG